MANGQYDNNMSGVLFRNDRKSSDTDPDYTGSCEIDHREMWLSAWIKESTKNPGKKFMRLSFRPKDQQQGGGGGGGTQMVTPGGQQQPTPTTDDDIPFAFLDVPLEGIDHRGTTYR